MMHDFRSDGHRPSPALKRSRFARRALGRIRTTRARRAATAAMAIALACLATPAIAHVTTAHASPVRASQPQSYPAWVGTWAAAPETGVTSSTTCPVGPGGFEDRTVRNIVYTSAGGDEVRIRLSNTFGTAPLTIGDASVAIQEIEANTVPGTMRELRFGGSTSVTIPAGAEVLSDPVDLKVRARQDLAVSVYVPSMTGPATFHSVTVQTSWVSTTSGDHAMSDSSTDYPQDITCWMFADGVEVPGSPSLAGSVIAFGDSITDGNQSNFNANDRWPTVLGRRLDAVSGPTMSVIDEGISGNQLLTDAASQGQSGLNRLQRDVIDQPGAKVVIMLIGTNDIRYTDVGQDNPPNTAATIINGYKQVIARVHAAGMRIIAGTMTPFLTLPVPTSGWQDAAGEAMREQVNHWILTSHAFDGVVNFSAALASPYDPEVYNSLYDSGDYLHPNDAGYQVMGDMIPLSLLLGDNQ